MFDTDKFASLTNEEYYALTGTLTPARIEELLNSEQLAELPEGIKPWLDEAEASYPAPDFLEGVAGNLMDIIRVTKGVRKGELQVLLEQIQDVVLAVSNDTDYGREKLQNVRSLLHD
jgi:hypothetical protein